MKVRIEKDPLGERQIPNEAYYGIQTHRALENFPISGLKPKSAYVEATVHIKKAAAIVNKGLRLLDAEKADAIVRAADEVLNGKLREWFVVDVYQAGAGTSHNMNANEVLANKAIEILGGKKGEYNRVHPNDDVNMSQSTNDVCPTAIRISALMNVRLLLPALSKLVEAFGRKSEEFDKIVKSGRTHLTDAVPVRLGQEFGGWATNIRKHIQAIDRASEECKELGIGGTATGTGLNAHPKYRELMVKQLSMQLGFDFRMAENYFESMQSLRPMVELSNGVRNLAQDLIRISNDIRLLASGPKTGLSEINLPAVQPGSSIMPGKVNPVLMEMMNMVCFQVIGCDTTVMMAAQAGQLELNVMMPVVAFNLLHEIEVLKNAVEVYASLCVEGITANEDRCKHYAEGSMSIVTVLNPHIGYAKAAEIAKEYLSSGRPIRELVLEKKLLSPEKLDEVFNLYGMTEPGIHR
ncbi:MAG: aspartate ammonia-lyase [Ignavibacteria bacterium]|nr:aspartate ammonia-lyase [Ignavibacteria bacterium]